MTTFLNEIFPEYKDSENYIPELVLERLFFFEKLNKNLKITNI